MLQILPKRMKAVLTIGNGGYDKLVYGDTDVPVPGPREVLINVLAAGDDATFIAAALGDIARAYGMVRLAKETGLTREGLYKTLSKDGNPSFSSILKVIHALGLKLKPEAA